MHTVRLLHYASGILLTTFIIAHLANHLIIWQGEAAHLALMDTLRAVYRQPVVECLLWAAVVWQVISGGRLVRAYRWADVAFFRRVQLASGRYMQFFLLFHTSAVLAGRYVLGVDTNLYFGAAGLNAFPACLFFVPYYGLAISSFFAHLASIHYYKMQKWTSEPSARWQSWSILAMGACATLAILWGLTAGGQGLPIPAAYAL